MGKSLQQNKILNSVFRLMLIYPILGYLYLFVGLPKTITFAFVFIFFIYGMLFLLKYHKSLEYPSFLLPLFFYMLYIPIRSHFAIQPDRHFLTNIYYDIVHSSIFFMLLIIYNTKYDEQFINKCIKVFKITVLCAATASVIQFLNPSFLRTEYVIDDFYGVSIYTIRRGSIFTYESLNLGLSFIPLLSVLVGSILVQSRKSPVKYLALSSLSVFLSNTRFIMISFIILILQLFVVNRQKIAKYFRYAIALLIVFFLTINILTYLGYDVNKWYTSRLFAEGTIKETTRYKAIDTFNKFFPRTAIFGIGVRQTSEIERASRAVGSSQIHVGYLAHLVSYGLLGSLLLFTFWLMLAKKLFLTARRTNYWGSFFAFLTFLWAQFTLVHYSIFFYGLIFAFIFDKYNQDKHNQYIMKK